MRRFVDRTASVVLAAALVVAGLELTSYAANGHPFVLGSRNSETRPASLTNTGQGPALALQAHGPALAVGNSRKIAHLNADAVDGKSAADLGTEAIRFTLPVGKADPNASFEGIPAGFWLVTYSLPMNLTGSASGCDLTVGTTRAGSTPWTTNAGESTLTGALLIHKSSPAEDVHIVCGGTISDAMTWGPAMIVFTRVDSVINGAVTLH